MSATGLAKLIHGCSSGGQSGTTSIVGPRGSIGYIPPEYGMGGEISTEGDVYSYGIVLLEMLTRKWPTNEEFSDGLTLCKYVDASLSRAQDILHPGQMHRFHEPKTFFTPVLLQRQEISLSIIPQTCKNTTHLH